MLKRFLLAAVLLLTACQSAAPTETIPETPEATSDSGSTSPGWLETDMNGVSFGMWRPAGWETDQNNGLVIAEHTVSSTGMIEGGVLIHCFVPAPDEFDVPDSDANYAWAVLDRVVHMPSHMGYDVVVSKPAAFQWDTYQAAYYLITTGDGVRALVIALAIPGMGKVVVCNISAPTAQSERIRAMLPDLLDDLTIDGTSLDGKALDALPNPLPFPRYSMAASTVSTQTAANTPP